MTIAGFRLQCNTPFVCMAFGFGIVKRELPKNVPGSCFVMQLVEQGFCVRKLSGGAAKVRVRLPDDHRPLLENRSDDFVELIK